MRVYIISEKIDLYNSSNISCDIENISKEDYCFISLSTNLEKVKKNCTFIQTDNLFCLEDDSAKDKLYSLLKEKSTILVNL